jgi:hypothetical protein
MQCARSISPARSSRCASATRVAMRPQASDIAPHDMPAVVQTITRVMSPSRRVQHSSQQACLCPQAADLASVSCMQASYTMQYTPSDQGQAVSPAAAPAAADSSQHTPRYYEEELSRLRTWKAKQSRFCVEALARSSSSGGSDH